jgi:hypothetical protein
MVRIHAHGSLSCSGAQRRGRVVHDGHPRVSPSLGPSLANLDKDLSGEDVLVCGDDATARARVLELAAEVTGRPGVDVGALRQARVLQPFTAVLIAVNRRYKTRAGVLLTHVHLARE